MSTSDTTLHEKWCTKRDADALTELILRHSALVFSACMRVLRNTAWAEDAAQDCFIELMQARGPIRPSVAGWLHTVATRRAVDRLRSELRRETREQAYADASPQNVEATWDEISTEIDMAIAALPEELRLPVVARFLEGQPHQAIAKDQNISLATVKRRLDAGLEAIRSGLRKRGLLATTLVLVGMLEEAPAIPLSAVAVAELGKRSMVAAPAGAGPVTVAVIKSGVTLGGALAVKNILVVATAAVIFAAYLSTWSTTTVKPVPAAGQRSVTNASGITARTTTASAAINPADDRVDGRVSAPTVSGVVLDQNDIPVPGATVSFYRFVGAAPDPIRETVSAVDGRFSFQDVAPADRLQFFAGKSGLVHLPDEAIYANSEATLQDVVLRLYPGASVSGRVIYDNRRPAVGMRVTARHPSDRITMARNSAVTQANGEFRIEGLLPGVHDLSVLPDGQESGQSTDERVELAPGESHSGLEIVLPGGELEIAGRVVDDAGAGIEGARVELRGVATSPRDTTDADGNFRMARVPEGSFWMAIESEGFINMSATATAGDEAMEIILTRSRLGAFTGRVVAAESGLPVVEFDVLVLDGSVHEVPAGKFGAFMPVVDEKGAFTVGPVEYERATVVARAPGRQITYAIVDRLADPPLDLVIALAKSTAIRGIALTPSGAPVADASIVLGDFPHDVQNSRLEPQSKLGNSIVGWFRKNAVTRSSADGRFVIDSPAPGTPHITAYHPEYGYGTAVPDTGAADGAELQVVLKSGATLIGTITLGDAPAAEVTVVAIPQLRMATTAPGTTKTDEKGGYRFTELPEGKVRVFVSLPTRSSRTQSRISTGRALWRDAELVGGETSALDFNFKSADSALAGTVFVDGEPATGGEVIVHFPETISEETQNAAILDDGRYYLDTLPSGAAMLIVHAETGRSETRTDTRQINLEAESSHTVDIFLDGGVSLEGTIVGLVPEEINVGVTVSEVGTGTPSPLDMPQQQQLWLRGQSIVEPDGSYEVKGLAPGVYTVAVHAHIVDDKNTVLRSRNSSTQVTVEGEDGDIVRLDLPIE